MTLHQPVRTREVASLARGVKTYAVEGTPSDSVIVGLERLVPKKVDLLVSGINEGSNLGEDILLSGTVGAAFQGYFRGVPSVAISVASLTNVNYGPAALVALALAIAKAKPSGRLLLNVNLPNVPAREIQGVEITRMGNRVFMDVAEEGHDGRRSYYWIKRNRPTEDLAEGTDLWAVRNKRVSITPLTAHLTDSQAASRLTELSGEVFSALRPD